MNLSESNNCFTIIHGPSFDGFFWNLESKTYQDIMTETEIFGAIIIANRRTSKAVLCGDWWKIWKGLVDRDEMTNRSGFKWFFTNCEVIVQILSDKGLSIFNFSWIFFVSEYQQTKDTGQRGKMFLGPYLLNKKIAKWAENSTYVIPLRIIRSVHFWQESNGWVIESSNERNYDKGR